MTKKIKEHEERYYHIEKDTIKVIGFIFLLIIGLIGFGTFIYDIFELTYECPTGYKQETYIDTVNGTYHVCKATEYNMELKTVENKYEYVPNIQTEHGLLFNIFAFIGVLTILIVFGFIVFKLP